jgi:hypothetical protein
MQSQDQHNRMPDLKAESALVRIIQIDSTPRREGSKS